jgi:hypothetical protein
VNKLGRHEIITFLNNDVDEVKTLLFTLSMSIILFLKNYTVQRRRSQYARTLTPMNTRTQTLPL